MRFLRRLSESSFVFNALNFTNSYLPQLTTDYRLFVGPVVNLIGIKSGIIGCVISIESKLRTDGIRKVVDEN